jgi:hypothetical protein
VPLPSLVGAGFDPAPSIKRFAAVSMGIQSHVPATATAVGVPVPRQGRVPPLLGVDRKTLGAAGFDGSLGQGLVVPRSGGPMLAWVTRPSSTLRRCVTSRRRSREPASDIAASR